MQVVIFDDKLSCIHFVLGLIAHYIPLISMIFLGYQLLSKAFKKEAFKIMIGDLCEFSLGLLTTSIITSFALHG